MFKNLPPYLKNKYALALLVFFLWMMFFDRNRVINQVRILNTLGDMRAQKEYYQQEIEKDSTALHILESDKQELERFAREKYLMKRDNEDVYLVVEED